MDDQQSTTPEERGSAALARWGRPGAFAAAGLVAGGLLAGALSANAADSGDASAAAVASGYSSGGPPGGPPSGPGNTDPSRPQRSDEQLLTGTTADKVQAAALAKYPGATVVRIETDSDGVYEAHLTKADGSPVTVEVDEGFTVTGTEQMGGPRGPHGDPAGQGAGSATSGDAA